MEASLEVACSSPATPLAVRELDWLSRKLEQPAPAADAAEEPEPTAELQPRPQWSTLRPTAADALTGETAAPTDAQ